MSKRILVAEDSSVIQNITKKVLQFQNYEIVSARNGSEVMKKLESENFDAILLDIQMPVMDGMECARKVRALPDPVKANIPIIAISGNQRGYTMEDFTQAGINQFLQKPLNFDQLVDVVREVTASAN